MAAAEGGGATSKKVPVRVIVRARPQNSAEKGRGEHVIVTCKGQDRVLVQNRVGGGGGRTSIALDKAYAYDRVYNQFAKQEDIFNECVRSTIDEVLQGYSATVFAYGQTGTGKTYTMEGEFGDTPNAGIIPRSIKYVFEHLQRRQQQEGEFEFTVRVSFLEVYNEQLTDLLSAAEDDIPEEQAGKARGRPSHGRRKTTERLKLVEDSRKGVVVQNLEEVLCHNAGEVFDKVRLALQKRSVAETKCNAFSSRSHGIFTLQVASKEKTVEGEDLLRVGKLHLVDLAGSECVGRSGAKDQQLREAGNINQSLLTLGRVISALVERRGHIPYRDSKLTRLLQDSLGGRTKTTIIATLSPSSGNIEETLSTLDYAMRARSIKNRPEVNQRMTKRQLIKDFSTEIDHLRTMLRAAREKDGVHLPAEEYEHILAARASAEAQLAEFEELKVAQEEELAKLGEQLQGMTAECEELKARQEQLEQELAGTQEQLQETTANLEEAKTDIVRRDHLVSAHEDTQAALQGQAGQLASEVKAAVSDVRGLHAKVGRQDEEATRHRHAAEQFRHQLDAQTRTLEGIVASMASAVSDRASEAKREAAQQAERAQAAQARLDRAVSDSKAIVNSLTGAVTDGCATVSAATKEGCEAVAKAASECAEEVDAVRSTQARRLQEAMQAIEQAMADQQDVARRWAERSLQEAAATARACEQFANEHAVALATHRDRAVEAFQSAAERFEAAKVAGAQQAKARAQQVEEAKRGMMAQFTAMIDGWATQQLGSISKEQAAQAEAMEGGMDDMEAAKEELREQGDAVRESAEQWAATTAAGCTAGAKATATEMRAAAEEAVTAATEAGSASKAAFDALATSAAEQTSTAMEKCGELAATMAEAAETSTAELLQACEEQSRRFIAVADDEVAVAAGENAAAWTEATATMATSHAASASAAKSASAGTSDWCSAERSRVAELLDDGLERADPTGTTPAKRSYRVPARMAALSPQGRVLGRIEERMAAGGEMTPTVLRSRAAREAEADVQVLSSSPEQPAARSITSPVAAAAAGAGTPASVTSQESAGNDMEGEKEAAADTPVGDDEVEVAPLRADTPANAEEEECEKQEQEQEEEECEEQTVAAEASVPTPTSAAPPVAPTSAKASNDDAASPAGSESSATSAASGKSTGRGRVTRTNSRRRLTRASSRGSKSGIPTLGQAPSSRSSSRTTRSRRASSRSRPALGETTAGNATRSMRKTRSSASRS